MRIAIFCIFYFFTSTTITTTNGENEDCCSLKDVGGKLYKFVDHVSEEDKKRLKCSNTCAYKHAEKDSDTKYCFKPGKLKSSCETGEPTFSIKIHNELESGIINGAIKFKEIDIILEYSVAAGETFKDPYDPETVIVEVTGANSNGNPCKPYKYQEGEEPKHKFKIVKGNSPGGCIILPASQQYHPVKSVEFTENGETVRQEDHFHPHTREAILKVPAHGKNKEATIIFQSSKKRSTEFGLMVTAAGDECHVHHLPRELGVDPEHMTKSDDERKRMRVLSRSEQQEMPKFHIVKTFQTANIISPDDENVKLTETMKKECEGKTIFYNAEHEVINGTDYSEESIQSKNDEEVRLLNRRFPQDERQITIPCQKMRFKYSHDAARSCGVWTYKGVDTTSGVTKDPFQGPFTNMGDRHIYSGTWQVLVKCCDDDPNQSSLMRCNQIPDGPDGEQAFSTAFYMGWRPEYQCIGKSKFCEWDPNARVFDGVQGACVSQCTSCCTNRQPGGGGCGKKYGWYPGFYYCDGNNYNACVGCRPWP